MPLIDRLRLFLIGFVVVSVGLPMAWISLGKLVLFLTCLVIFGQRLLNAKGRLTIENLLSVKIIILTVAVFGLSLLWTQAPVRFAVEAFVKHSKLLEIVMLASLITSRGDAKFALAAFLMSQTILILTSWAMAFGVTIPWATSQWAEVPQYKSIVFSTYLDQTLIFAVDAAVFWHFRAYWPRLRILASALAGAALVNVLMLQQGRTGYLAALSVLSIAVMWELPTKSRLPALVIAPLLLAMVAYVGSDHVRSRVAQVVDETTHYLRKGTYDSSSGFRLHAWRRSAQAVADSPLYGYGAGSWTQTVKRIEGANSDQVFGSNSTSNPHQEYLLWAVELGVGGALLLMALLYSIWHDAQQFSAPAKRATVSTVAVVALACFFNASLYDALIGSYFCVALGLLLGVGLMHRQDTL